MDLDVLEVSRRFQMPKDVFEDGNGRRVWREIVLVLEQAEEYVDRCADESSGEEEKPKLHEKPSKKSIFIFIFIFVFLLKYKLLKNALIIFIFVY